MPKAAIVSGRTLEGVMAQAPTKSQSNHPDASSPRGPSEVVPVARSNDVRGSIDAWLFHVA
jgi:hypothetical protein